MNGNIIRRRLVANLGRIRRCTKKGKRGAFNSKNLTTWYISQRNMIDGTKIDLYITFLICIVAKFIIDKL